MSQGVDYAAAGVSVAEGDRAVELMKQWVERARRPEVVGGVLADECGELLAAWFAARRTPPSAPARHRSG